MKKILVIDDEVGLRELLRKVLGAQGFDVITSPSAEQGLERLFQEPFDLLILDVKLKNESGLTVLQKIRASNIKIPIIIFSGLVTAELEKEARLIGANEVLAKDAGIQVLTVQIKKFIQATERVDISPALAKKKRILIVDNEESIRRLLTKFFRDKGYDTLEAENGQKALEMIAHEEVSVVLLDIEMPVMDGLQTLEELVKVKPGLGVVMATGVQSDERVAKALALGAYGYVLKPFDFLYLDLVVASKLAIAS